MTRIAVRQRRPDFRRCLVMAVLLAGTAALAGGGSPPEKTPRHGHETFAWRRTCNGWEQPPWLMSKRPPRVVPFHPFLAAVLLVLVAAMALVGYEPCVCVHVPPPAPHFGASAARAASPMTKHE